MVDQEVSTICDSTEKQFNVLNPRDYQQCMEELSKNENLFDLIRKGFQLKYEITRGLQVSELQEIIQSECGSSSRLMLEEIEKLSPGQSTWLGTTLSDSTKRDTILIHGKLVDDKYDVLNIRATQVKQFDERKLFACGLGAVCAGVLFGAVATPVAGVIASGSILAASGVKAAYDYRKVLPDLIYGYIFKELVNKDVIIVENDRFRI